MKSGSHSYKHNLRKVSTCAYIVVFAIILDVMLSMSIDVLDKYLVSLWGVILLLAIIAAIYIGSQYLILEFVNEVSHEMRIKNSYFRIMYKTVLLFQYILGAIMLITILQIIIMGKYSIGLIIAGTAISYTLATIIMIMFSYHCFFTWY